MSDHDPGEIAAIREHGAELVTAAYGLFKTLKVFDINNKSSMAVFERFQVLVQPFFEFGDSVSIQLIGNQYFINGNKVIVGYGGYETFQVFSNEMTRRGVGTITISQGYTSEEIVSFAKFFMDFMVSDQFKDNPFDEFSTAFEGMKIEHIDIKRLITEETVASASEEQFEEEVANFLKTVYVLLKIFEAVQNKARINLKNAKRTIQKLVSVIENDPERMLTLLKVADLGNYLAFHSVNVSVYSIMIGNKLGLSKVKAALVGICGLFHDLGMLYVPEETRLYSGPLNADQWQPIWQHPVEGAKILLKTERIVEAMTRAMQVSFQHQMRDDEMGYPQLGYKHNELNLFTRIVKVADAYDAMTQARPYRAAMTEARALQELLANTESVYDRIIIKVFANVLGIYPVGISVKLNTGEVGSVYKENPDLDYKDKPVVRVYADAQGRKVDKLIDLMEKDMGIFKYWIVPFDEQELDLDVSDFISIM